MSNMLKRIIMENATGERNPDKSVDNRNIILNKPRFTIGRRQNNDLVLPSLSVSRQHCVLSKDSKLEWYLEVICPGKIQVNSDKWESGTKRIIYNGDLIYITEMILYQFICLNESARSPLAAQITLKNENSMEKEKVSAAHRKFQEEEAKKRLKLEQDHRKEMEQLEEEESKKKRKLEEDHQIEVERLNDVIGKLNKLHEEKIKKTIKLEEDLQIEVKQLNEVIKKLTNDFETNLAEQHIQTTKLQEELKNKSQMLAALEEVLETEAQCAICLEIVMVPSTLNCGHTFCGACIGNWRKKNAVNCPTCRSKVAHATRCAMLETILDRVTNEVAGADMKRKRDLALQERGIRPLAKRRRKVVGSPRGTRVPEPELYIDLTTSPN